MAGLDPAIHVLSKFASLKDVDGEGKRSDAVLRTAMDKPGHDEIMGSSPGTIGWRSYTTSRFFNSAMRSVS